MRHYRYPIYLIALLTALVISGCSTFAPSQRSAPQLLPPTFSLYSPSPAQNSVDDHWWQTFAGDELNNLMTIAFADNFSVRQAWARLRQAKARTNMTMADSWPDLNYTGQVDHRHQGGDGGHFSSENYALGVLSSYELDLWGRIRAQINNQQLQQQATEQDWATATITLSAEVVNLWLNIVANQQQLQVEQQHLHTAQTVVDLTKLRYMQGQVARAAVVQRQQQLAQYRASLALLEQERNQLYYNLNLLLGRAPTTPLLAQDNQLPALTALPNIGIPAGLLASRPDVRAAGLRLCAADWQVSAAKADRLPALRLTANGGYNSVYTSELFDNWLLNLAASVSGPIFDGGRRRAEVVRTQALVDELLANYQQTVLVAVTEVESALLAEAKIGEQLQAIARQIDRAEQLVADTQRHYVQGDGAYLEVLDRQQSLHALQLQWIRKQRDQLMARVDLHRALGGSPLTRY